jgi:electron transfer flavoprotein alpha/beta subunit
LNVAGVDTLGLAAGDLQARTMVEEIFLPPETEGAQFIEGDPAAVADEILRILKEKGVSI